MIEIRDSAVGRTTENGQNRCLEIPKQGKNAIKLTDTPQEVHEVHKFTKNLLVGWMWLPDKIISGYESELYQKLFKGWHVEKHTARAGIGQTRIEVLWIKKPGYRLF